MSLATEGDYGDDLGHGYIRRPISVAQLLEREGYRPAARSRATRRALTGVAAGAVLALGAVVGSLLLNHAGNNTAGDTLASGSGGNEIVLGNHQPAVATYPKNVAQQQTSTGTTTPQTVSAPSTTHVQTHPQTPARVRPAVSDPVVPQSATRSATTTPATSTTQSAPTTSTTTTAPATGTPSTNAPVQPAPTPTSSAPSNGGGNGNGNNGGLLGAVTGTLTGTLNSVTQPVFSWFG